MGVCVNAKRKQKQMVGQRITTGRAQSTQSRDVWEGDQPIGGEE